VVGELAGGAVLMERERERERERTRRERVRERTRAVFNEFFFSFQIYIYIIFESNGQVARGTIPTRLPTQISGHVANSLIHIFFLSIVYKTLIKFVFINIYLIKTIGHVYLIHMAAWTRVKNTRGHIQNFNKICFH